MTKKITQKDIDAKEIMLGSNEAILEFKLTLKDLNFIRQSLQRFAEFHKEEAIKINNKSYYDAEEKAERIAKRSQDMMTAEILADDLWEKTNLYKDYIKPIRDMEWELDN